MDSVLDLLATVTPATAKAAADLIGPDLLASSTTQQKHKLKTRISALLKSSGTNRAVGAVLARRALIDWSIVKTHGATWAPILLHVLDLPDRVGWAPAIRTLSFLYTQVHGKTDLSRETGGSKIGEFMKRLIKVLPEVDVSLYYVVTRMLNLYPTQCRPYLNKLAPILDVPGAETAMTSLCLAERAPADVWQQRFVEVLSKLEQAGPAEAEDLGRAHQLALLREYCAIAADVKAKIPAARLVRVVNVFLKSYRPVPTLQILDFMLASRSPLETLYIQSFDSLLYSLVDCMDLGKRIAILVAEFMAWELCSVGWASENYAHVLTRLTKKLLQLASHKHESIGAEGLADYVQNAASFKQNNLSADDSASVARYFAAVVLCVPTIPQSVRMQMDYFLLSHGTDAEVILATLYAGRYSILPLAIHKRLSNLQGLEALVHPRFPPLNISQHALQSAQDVSADEASAFNDQGASTNFSVSTADTAGAGSTADPAVEDDAEPAPNDSSEQSHPEIHEERPLPPIPESVKPVRHSELEVAPPEKRQKLSDEEIDEAKVPPTTSTVIFEKTAEDNDDDSEDELVIPTLTMDSD